MRKNIVDWLGFDPRSVSPSDTLDGKCPLIPDGDYVAVATCADYRETKECNGCWMWQMTFAIDGGPFNGRRLVVRYNVVHSNPLTEEAGRAAMRHYLDIIGLDDLKGPESLCGKPVVLSVTTDKIGYYDKNGAWVEDVVNDVTHIGRLPSGDQSEVQPEQLA